MGRLIPAGTGMQYYRGVKIAGEDVVEEEPAREFDETLLSEEFHSFREQAPTLYSGGLTEEPAEETLPE